MRSIVGEFTRVMSVAVRQADANARMRIQRIGAQRMSGSDASCGTFEGSTKRYGLCGKTEFDDFYLG